MHKDIEDSELGAEGYTVFRRDRQLEDKTRGGGVLLLIKDSLAAMLREDLYRPNFPESVWCNIGVGRNKVLVGVCYRPPDSRAESDEALINLVNIVSKEKCIIMGDFNFRDIPWDEEDKLDESHQFVQCVNDNFLHQLVTRATRGDNILDLVLTTDGDMIKELDVDEPFGTSDHNIIRFKLVTETENSVTFDKPTFEYFNADYDKIRQNLHNINWDRIIDNDSVEETWCKFKAELINVRDSLVDHKKSSKHKKYKWVTRKVIKSRRAKEKAWKKYKLSNNNPELYNKYKEKLKISLADNIEAKKQFEQRLALDVKKNSKAFFAYINSKKIVKSKVGPLKDDLGNLIVDNKECANLLNNYFSTVFTIEDTSNIPEPKRIFQGAGHDILENIEITPDIVESKLNDLNVNKSVGSDGFHPKFLFEIRKEISKPLAILLNLSFQQGKVPLDWKFAIVSPIFKQGSKSNAQNYRPISLTSVLCKILESIIKDRVVAHLDKFNLIRDSQHGFMKGRSCLTNLLEFMEKVTEELDKNNPVDIVYLDFAKAFDKVPHKRLIKKIVAHGIGGKFSSWIEDWLSDRTQCVRLNDKLSETSRVLSGVPQGSVLGPLLFLIYINDLDIDTVSKLCKFADDTKLCKAVKTDADRDQVKSDLDKIYNWSLDWQMLFNVDKCVALHLGNNNKKFEYYMGTNQIKSSDREKDLGVIVGCSAKNTEQCIAAANAANKMLGLIKRNIQYKNKDTVSRLYKALVRPKLEYCVQAWCPYLRKDIDRLERVQKRATKMIPGLHNLSYAERLKECNLLSLEKRRLRGDLIEVFKLLKGLDKVDYRKFFQLNIGSRTRGHSFKVVKNRSNLDLRKYFFSQRVVDVWNRLPQSVVDADTVNTFKNRLDKCEVFAVQL